MFRILCCCLLLLTSTYSRAQKFPSRISPVLLAKPASYFEDRQNSRTYILEMPERTIFSWPDATVKYMGRNIWLITTKPAVLLEIIGSGLPYSYIDEQVKPVPEGGVISYNMGVNRINKIWQEFPALNGDGEVVSVKENRMDTNDIDLLKRYVPTEKVSPLGETHATVMTTLIAGAGVSSYKGQGVAPKALYSSADFFNVLPEEPAYYTNNGIHLENHSYGTGIQNFYGVNARAFDLSANENLTLLHVFSAGNSGTVNSGQGIYGQVRGYANITGNMKMAKNVFLVGATDETSVAAQSSRGPLYDGRIAPHVVAFGEDGSSGAAALASGVSLLLQQEYKKLNGLPAPSALIRAVLINSADDTGNEGPDYVAGFGRMNAYGALRTIQENRLLKGELSGMESREFQISVPVNSRELKLTLTWADPAAESGAAKSMINDLDLELIAPGGEVIAPWILSIFPNADSLAKPSRRGVDTLNIIEQVSLQDPAPGVYVVRVKARQLKTAAQDFHVAYALRGQDIFEWDFPQADDVMVSGEEVSLLWSESFGAGVSGVLEQRIDGGAWELVSDNVDLNTGVWKYQLDPGAYELEFRMRIGAQEYMSGKALVAPDLINQFAFVCDTTILNYWASVPGASSYKLYRLDDDSMKNVASTTDTFALVQRQGSEYFSVASVVNGRESFRGGASSFIFMGTGCYIDNFLVDLLPDNTARLQLDLGSDFHVERVEFRKQSAGGKILFTSNSPTAGIITTFDDTLHQGLNIYQVYVHLSDGSVIKSREETVYYLGGKQYLLYPNPVIRGQDIFLLTEQPDDQQGVIYDVAGRVLLRFTIEERNQRVPVSSFPAGYYLMRIFSGAGTEVLRFLVL